MQGVEIFKALIVLNVSPIKNDWMEGLSDFELFLGVTIDTKSFWPKVRSITQKLAKSGVHNIEDMSKLDEYDLSLAFAGLKCMIKKTKLIHSLAIDIMDCFASFEDFKLNVSTQWLLKRKGIGPAHALLIQNLACKQDVMIISSKSNIFLSALGFELESWEEIQEYLAAGISLEKAKLNQMLGTNYTLNELYFYFHSSIIQYVKTNFTAGKIEHKAKKDLRKILGF